MKELIKLVDIFGQPISLTLNKRKSSKTIIGGLLSIFMFVLLLAMFIVTAQDLINHTNPQVAVESVILKELPEIYLDKNLMPLALALTRDSNLVFNKPEYFKYNFSVLWGNTSESLTETFYNLTECRKEFFPLLSEETYESSLISDYMCVENKNVTVWGSWQESSISYVSLSVRMCQNKTDKSGPPCASEEEISQFLRKNSLFFTFLFQDSIINTGHADKPVEYTVKSMFSSLKQETYKIIEVYFKNQTLLSDDGFIFRTSNMFETFKYDYHAYDDSNLLVDKILVEFIVQLSNNKSVYKRRYQKIQEVLAGIGGLANLLNTIFIVISYIFSTVRMHEALLNQIYDYDIDEVHRIKINNKMKNSDNIIKSICQTKNEKTNNLSFSLKDTSKECNKKFNLGKINLPATKKNYSHRVEKTDIEIKEITTSNNILKENECGMSILSNNKKKSFRNTKEIIEFLNERKRRHILEFSYLDILKVILCCKNCLHQKLRRKYDLYKKSKSYVLDVMDITFIIQKIEELEKLKIVLFNPQQLALFNFISKEFISLNEDKIKNHKLSNIKSLLNSKEDLIHQIIEVKNKINSNIKVEKYDKKLFELINEELKY